LLAKINGMKADIPESYWKYDLRGPRRATLAGVVGAYKTGMKAQEMEDVLEGLQLTKDVVDSKIKDLEESIRVKESKYLATLLKSERSKTS